MQLTDREKAILTVITEDADKHKQDHSRLTTKEIARRINRSHYLVTAYLERLQQKDYIEIVYMDNGVVNTNRKIVIKKPVDHPLADAFILFSLVDFVKRKSKDKLTKDVLEKMQKYYTNKQIKFFVKMAIPFIKEQIKNNISVDLLAWLKFIDKTEDEMIELED